MDIKRSKKESAKAITPLKRGKPMHEVKSVIENQKHGVVRTRVTTGKCVT